MDQESPTFTENGKKTRDKGASRFDLEQTYKEFERLRGYDIRTLSSGDTLVSQARDTRDVRDPQALGEALLQRPADITITEWADALEKAR